MQKWVTIRTMFVIAALIAYFSSTPAQTNGVEMPMGDTWPSGENFIYVPRAAVMLGAREEEPVHPRRECITIPRFDHRQIKENEFAAHISPELPGRPARTREALRRAACATSLPLAQASRPTLARCQILSRPFSAR